VALHEGVFSRMYQLTELQVYTAGGSSSDLHIPGLPKEEAERIKSFLLNKITVLENVSTVIDEPLVSEEMEEEIQEETHWKEETPSDLDSETQH
jgi:uncharacterized membrane protein YdbT with pleckstrin-like domain